MDIIIHQAICGEQNKAWDLLSTTLADTNLAKKIAFKTDLQDSPPSGVTLPPVVRGFLYNDYYLIIKTYPDHSTEVRNGRVFSHCVIVEKGDLPKINDLTELFSIFKPEIDKSMVLEPIIINVNDENKIKLNSSLQLRFNKVIQCILNLEAITSTILWAGQNDYEVAVAKLWQLLTNPQKESFNFGINFNPSEIAKNRINFIQVPENIESKFDNKGFCVIRKSDVATLTDFSEQFLAGESNAIDRLTAFSTAFDFREIGVKELAIVAKGVTTFEHLNDTQDLKLLFTLSNIVAKFSPDEASGVKHKNQLVERILNLVDGADPADIFLLKSFPVQGFKDSKLEISKITDKWVNKHLFSAQPITIRDYSIIIKVLQAVQSNWWIQLVKEKIFGFVSQVTKPGGKIIWNWVENEPDIFGLISSLLDKSKKAEGFLIENIPNAIDKLLAEHFKSLCIINGWLKLIATILKNEYDLKTAIAEQLKIDADANHYEGLEIICLNADPEDIINIAILNNDKRCITIAAKLCSVSPLLLEGLIIENLSWQAIWLISLNNGLKASDGIKNAQKTIYDFLDLLIQEKPYSEELLAFISETAFANVLNYTNRNDLWAKLTGKVKNGFLVKTSSVFLEELSKNSTFQIPEDLELSEFVVSHAITTFLYYNRGNIKSSLPIFNTYRQLPEHILNDYITNYSGPIDFVDATQLGKLVLERSLTSVAYSIFHKSYHNKKFIVALNECYSLLDLITRGIAWAMEAITNIEFTPDEWWASFTAICYKLYSSGPMENKIWKQADGEEYDLLTRGTGKEVWIAALNKLRNGGCTGITVKKLLKKMADEHRKNKELLTLKDLWSKI